MKGLADDAWFAGFADGEGCFAAYRRPNSRNPNIEYIQPRFMVLLRADDIAILEQLCATFGGSVTVHVPSAPSTPSGANPQGKWQVRDKPALTRLVAYFDQFPLRAKKARDYAIWRRIVRLYVARGGAADFDEMEALRIALVEGRAYETLGLEAQVDVAATPQLRLVEEA